MTNNEMLKADLLDIIFERRNKAYGAYALRKGYDKRLLTALGAGMGVAAILVFLAMGQGNPALSKPQVKKEEVIIREYVIPAKRPETPKQPETVKKPVAKKPLVKTAQVKYVNQFEIKKDELVKTPVATVESMKDKQIGDTEIKGKPDPGIVKAPEPADPGNGTAPESGPSQPFEAREAAPEFPGGPNALYQFLSRNLKTPDELGAGEKILVKVRFKVDIDGSVTGIDIVESGGPEYDSEVLRVCKKMPRWKPGFQNGASVAVNYMIPVTFVGPE